MTKKYLETAQSEVQWRDRFWKVAEDKVKINGTCELGADIGLFGAGTAANKIADSYMDEMVETETTKNLQEELNLEIFKTVSLEKGLDQKKRTRFDSNRSATFSIDSYRLQNTTRKLKLSIFLSINLSSNSSYCSYIS